MVVLISTIISSNLTFIAAINSFVIPWVGSVGPWGGFAAGVAIVVSICNKLVFVLCVEISLVWEMASGCFSLDPSENGSNGGSIFGLAGLPAEKDGRGILDGRLSRSFLACSVSDPAGYSSVSQ
jgi:hypothetical protein